MATFPKRKVLSQQATTGQRGINLIESIVLKMGSIWVSRGAPEVGIDGFIELCNPTTREALSTHLAVQSKAVEKDFASETNSGFSFHCDRRDLDYWRRQNVPVLLIVSRPSTDEVYWQRISPALRSGKAGSLTLHFDKQKNRFSPDSFHDLLREGSAPALGLSVGPLQKRERLLSNLMPVTKLPKRIFLAATEMTHPGQVWAAFKSKGARPGGHWIIRGHQLLGFHDFSERLWRDVCDTGSVESFGVEEWAQSEDTDRVSDFRQLLHRAVEETLFPQAKYRRDLDCFYVGPSRDGKPVQAFYRSLTRDSSINVFNSYSKTMPDGRIFTHHRHSAFQPRFRQFGGRHYLEITPTYLFTRDGKVLARFHSELLAGIKRLEGNRAVLSQVMLWADMLNRPANLLSVESPFVEFGPLVSFDLSVGIDDDKWQQNSQECADRNDEDPEKEFKLES